MQEFFVIKDDFTLSEYLRITFYVMSKTKIIRRLVLFVTVVGMVNMLLQFSLQKKQETVAILSIITSLMLPAFTILFLLVSGSLIILVLFKMRPDMFTGNEYTINNWGVHKKGKKLDVSIQWDKFRYYRESTEYFFLYINDNMQYIIKKKGFSNDEEIKMFKSLINKKLPYRK